MKNKNHLANEKSPYLLQHAGNPVDWYPWCNEAFEKAKLEDKPIFLSIGYSTCHWCHVMAHESFEDEKIAKLMNETFVSIKVDREERPDIDGIYMTICQMLTGNGGWPLTIIMTPDKMPFFAGTYLPKQEKFGRIGMIELISKIKQLWQEQRNDILKSANEITEALNKEDSAVDRKDIPYSILFETAYKNFFNRFDNQYGGFGTAPKFPMPHNLIFLLRYWKRNNEHQALSMVEQTLQKMYSGGIYDNVGFGFHRYSTDREWLVPHFEKMLYDQALLSVAYTETFLATKNIFYQKVAEEILTYVLRDMTSPSGGFYTAEDADSEGIEGKFYLWTDNEIRNILGKDAEIFIRIFNVEQNGNWIEQASGNKNGTNILSSRRTPDEINQIAVEFNIPPHELKIKIEKCRKKLFEQREKRIHPYKDDKILTDWNSLMIIAFAKAYQAFDKKEYLDAAENAAKFIFRNFMLNNGSLLHRFRDGESGIHGNIDDYAFFIAALIDLYEASFNTEYLEKAISLNDYLIKHFWDESGGGFFFVDNNTKDLLIRQKEIYDGAVPSGNSVAMLNLLKLGRITGNTNLETMAQSIAGAFSKSLLNMPSAFTQSLIALDFASGSIEVVIAGEKDSGNTNETIKKIRSIFYPNKIILLNDNEKLNKIAPFTADQKMIRGKATVYVCTNFTCKKPVTEIEEIKELF
jgi:uncharacterized protein YyaL (SSP411 family)